MDEIKICFDREGKTLSVWFDNPTQEYVCEETGDEVILMKNQLGKVIGFEKLNFTPPSEKHLRIAFEAA